jgi:hypothetical protein
MAFLEMAIKGPPAANQLEVCVFGPNYGECIVVHLGNGHWVVVDSCLQDGVPGAIAYLTALGVDPGQAIKVVLATHWHDDHFKGLSEILAVAPDAHIWIASPLTDREFLRFVTRVSTNKTAVAGNKLAEFSKIVDEIARRRAAGLVTFGFASSKSLIFRLDASASGHGFPCDVMALSPSPGDYLNFLERIAANMPQARQTKRTVPSPSPNDVSVAAIVSAGPISILLGADVENSGKPTSGWEAILAAHAIQPIGPRASLYKIAHHGSQTAYNFDIWASLLVGDPLAVLTPWRRGRRRLPTPQDVRLILDLSSQAFATASDARSRRRRGNRPPGVLRFLRENEPRIRVRSLTAPFGAARFRTLDFQGSWSHELFGAASHLSRMVRTPAVR